MSRSFRAFFAVAVLLLAGGCSTSFDPPSRPAAISHLDVVNKQAYIDSVKSTLKIFHASAHDLRSREKPLKLFQLSEEADRYIELQVHPIIEDFEADNNLTTRLEIAKVQLLCGMVYLELDNPEWKIYQLLREMERRYGDQPDVLYAAIDRNDIGFGTISEGMQSLDELRFR